MRDIIIVDELPPLDSRRCTLSRYSRYYYCSQQRMIVRRAAIEFAGRLELPQRHVRDWMLDKFRRGNYPRKGEYEFLLERRMPLQSITCQIENAAYVDLSAAWYTAARLLGWHGLYSPGRYVSPGEPINLPSMLAQNKVARSSVVSMSRPLKIRIWTGEHVQIIQPFNPLLNADMWAWVADVMCALWSEVIIRIYPFVPLIITDCVVVPECHASSVIELAHDWGFEARVKYRGRFFGLGGCGYTIGQHYSMTPFPQKRKSIGMEIMPIEQIVWLKSRARKIIKWRQMEAT